MGRCLDLAKHAMPASPQVVRCDPYAERLRTTLQAICGLEYPAGMIPWLRSALPDAHIDLTSRLVNEIDRLGSALASLPEFDQALAVWLKAHRTACELYRAACDLSRSPDVKKLSTGVPKILSPASPQLFDSARAQEARFSSRKTDDFGKHTA